MKKIINEKKWYTVKFIKFYLLKRQNDYNKIIMSKKKN